MNPIARLSRLGVLLFLVLPLSAHSKESMIYLYDPCQHVQEYMLRGKLVAQQEISQGKLHRFVYVGDGVLGTTPKAQRKAEAEAAILNRMTIATTIDVPSDLPDCTLTPYRMGYEEEMEKAIEQKFGKPYRARVEQQARGRR